MKRTGYLSSILFLNQKFPHQKNPRKTSRALQGKILDLESDKISLINKLRGFEDTAAAGKQAASMVEDSGSADNVEVLKDQIEALKAENDQMKKVGRSIFGSVFNWAK